MPPNEIHLVAPKAPLETSRLLLEPLKPAHAAMLYENLKDERLYRFIRRTQTISRVPPATSTVTN